MAITINVNLDEILQALKDDLDFTGNADKYIKVNATADGFEFAAVSVGSTWGSITGTLSDQTDLQSALDLKANLAGAAFTGDVSVTTSGSGDTLQLTNSGSGTTLNILNSGSGDFLTIDTNKLVVDNGGKLSLTSGTTSSIPLTINASAGQTADLFEVKDNEGVKICRVKSNGDFYVGRPTPAAFGVGSDPDGGYHIALGHSNGLWGLIRKVYYPMMGIRNAADIELFNAERVIYKSRIDSNRVVVKFEDNTTNTYNWFRNVTKIGGVESVANSTLEINIDSTSTVGQIIQAAAGQTANLQEWKDSAGNILASIGSAGKLSIGSTGGLRYNPGATRYTDYNGLNLGGGIYMSFPSTGSDSFAFLVGGSATSNIYMYCNAAGNINTRGSILLGAADGAATLAGAVSSAQLEVRSTTKGFLPPVMTGAQVEAISSPAEGLIAYATNAGAGDVTAKGLYIYNGTNWVSL